MHSDLEFAYFTNAIYLFLQLFYSLFAKKRLRGTGQAGKERHAAPWSIGHHSTHIN